ncbi:MAG TPA: VWA domain-containing protein [Pyrinomonadaceae bacterium]|nr:VWA domain-containing protein [Pyrinomonadaceae bacterium]
MKRKSIYILLSVFCFGLIAAFHDFSVTSAQTSQTSPRPPNGVPTPTPQKSASPASKPAPTVSPTPEDEDDGGIIRIDTEEVNLNVRVINRNNRPINNLRQDEFKVYEDNVLQPITSFTRAEVPTNYSLVLDNSGSLRTQLEKIIEAGKIIINTNKPADETSIIRFVSRDKISIEQDFTPNKADLTEALDNLYVEGGQTAIIDAVYLAAEKVDQYENSRNPNEKKRRALILVSDGEDRDSYYKEAQLFELLREADVQIFTVGFVTELSKEGGFIGKSPQGKAKAFLERLATDTGGKSYFPNSVNELTGIAQDIATELRTQYLVSYSPTDDKKDGSFKNIKVVVGDGPNKEKRIAITRTGRNSVGDKSNLPVLQKTNPQIKGQ